jgi:predicted transcriptional regulator
MTTHRTISFRIPAEKVDELDALAKSMDRDRSYVLNEAVDNYLQYQRDCVAKIEAGLQAIDRGELIDHEDAMKMAKSRGTRHPEERHRKTA